MRIKTFKAWMFAGLGLLMISVVIFCLSAIRVTRQNVAQTPAVPKATLLDQRYVLGADSLPQSGVPAGTVSDFSLEKSGTYPGYSHRWWLYVPAGYDGKTPLALMVLQDGRDFVARDGTWRVPVALDNLIFRNELPLMVALFIDPGHAIRPTELASEQRSYEYDTLSDQYARFVITEMLPEIKKHVRVTDNPNGRGIAGFSSGGTCAFTVAWRRSDQFRKIFSANGSFVNIRGAGAYPDIVRQSPRKRLRVFLQGGVNDEPGGRFRGLNWPEGNRAMAAALASKGYDYQLVMGEGMHTGRHGAAIFPDAMRWLWRDYRAQ